MIGALRVDISARDVLSGTFLTLLNTGGPKGSGSKQLLRGIPENKPGRTPALRETRAGSRALRSRSGRCAGRSTGERRQQRTDGSPAACPQPPPSSRPLGMGGGTRAGARRNPATGSLSPERLRLRGPPFTVLPEESGRRSAPASTRGSLGSHRVEPLEQAAAPTDRALGPGNAFPSNPALPPPANGRCSRRAPLPHHVIRPAQPLVPPSGGCGPGLRLCILHR